MHYRFIHCLCILILIPALSSAAPPPGIPDAWSSGYVYANGVRPHYYRAVPAPGKPFDDLAATCRRSTPKWDLVDCQYWALSKKQYHGPYTTEAGQAMSGTMATGDSLGRIPVSTLILKADASPEVRRANDEAASVLKQGRLVHIDGAGHSLHHDELQRTLDVLTPLLSSL